MKWSRFGGAVTAVLCLLSVVSAAYAQDRGTVNGRVTAVNGEAIPGVSVTIRGTRMAAVTDSEGRFQISDVPVGRQLLQVASIGYYDASQPVTVRAGASANVEIVLETQVVSLNELVVTGTVAPTSRREIPVPITVITAREIERERPQVIQDLFRGQVPGVVAPEIGQGQEGYNGRDMYIRGSTSIEGGNQVKVLIDGVEMAKSADLHTIDPGSIERIEILRGPQASTIYGSGALDGVIQIFTKRGALEMQPQFEVVLSGGTLESFANRIAPQMDHRVTMTGGTSDVSYNVSANYKYRGDWTPDFFVEDRNISGGLRFQHGKVSLNLTAMLADRASQAGINPFTREQIITGEYTYTPASVAPARTRNDHISQTYAASVDYRPTSWWRHTLTVGTDQRSYDGGRVQPTYLYPADSTSSIYITTDSRNSYAYNTSATLDLASWVDLSLTAGADVWRWRNRRTTETMPREEENRGWFGQAHIDLWEALTFTAGVRIEDNPAYGDEYGYNVAPRFGTTFTRQFGNLTMKLRGSYGSATRPPTMQQQAFIIITPTQHHIENPDLGPEYQKGGDAGVEFFFGNRGNFSVTWYDQTVRDLIAEVWQEEQNPFFRWRQHQNLGDIKNKGWEFEGAYQLGTFDIRGSYALIDSRILSIREGYRGSEQPGDRMTGIARNTAALSVGYSVPGSYMQVNFTQVGKMRKRDDRAYSLANRKRLSDGAVNAEDFMLDDYPATNRINFTATRDINHRYSAFLRVNNITDDYSIDASNDAPVLGRQTIVGLRVRF